MANLFSGLSGNIKFPEVVMNAGPLPPQDGLPAPLHSQPDGRINYNSTLLGDITPYTNLGEPGYLSSQAGYLNIPHRIQKIIPPLYLPEPDGKATFKLSHGVDDSDLAFVMRLCRHSIFCTGKGTSTQRNGLGTNIDPFINLCTLNYILACIQITLDPFQYDPTNLWWEFLYNLDSERWPKEDKRDYRDSPLNFTDLQHLVSHCIRPFGIVRGSERQGGQNEISLGPATWPTSFVTTLVIDGKEANVVNVWHNRSVNANDDLVLRFMPKKCGTYVLNHYYKGYASKHVLHPVLQENFEVWQMVPEVKNLEIEETNYYNFIQNLGRHRRETYIMKGMDHLINVMSDIIYHLVPWQALGYWHIGRSQVMIHRYGVDDFYKDDMANNLRTNHLQMTVQPTWYKIHHVFERVSAHAARAAVVGSKMERSLTQTEQRVKRQKVDHDANGWLNSFADFGQEDDQPKDWDASYQSTRLKEEDEPADNSLNTLSEEPGENLFDNLPEDKLSSSVPEKPQQAPDPPAEKKNSRKEQTKKVKKCVTIGMDGSQTVSPGVEWL